jgi:peptide-methionine (S)-S-oxide reductase
MKQNNVEYAYFAAGCFWCPDAVFRRVVGIIETETGYAGGRRDNPSYEQVTTGVSGHAEVLKITYHPSKISYEQLLDIFFAVHDPTTLNKQGYDEGTQYRSAIFTANDQQEQAALKKIDQLSESGEYEDPIVTEVEPLEAFFPAERYHQDYYDSNRSAPYCKAIIDPKVAKLFKQFPELVKVEYR